MGEYLELVRLTPLMELTRGNPKILIGLIDRPVAIVHSRPQYRENYEKSYSFMPQTHVS